MSEDTWVASTFWHTGMQISLQDPAPGAGIAESYSNSMFSVLKNSHTVFHNICTILQPISSGQGLQFLHIFVNTYFLFFPPSVIGHPNGSEGKYITFSVRK